MPISALRNGNQDTHELIASRGLAYGDGLFETIAYHNHSLQLWERHMDRLLSGCRRLNLSPPDTDTLKEESLSLLADKSQGVIKIVLVRNCEQRGYSPIPSTGVERIVQAFEWPQVYKGWQSQGVTIGLCAAVISENRMLAGIKHLNRLEQVMAAREVTENAWDEGLMSTQARRITCGTKSNIFTITNNNVINTPALETCGVSGVMRAEIISTARKLKLKVTFEDIEHSDLRLAEGAFISNALIGLAPVAKCHLGAGSNAEALVFSRHELIDTLQAALRH